MPQKITRERKDIIVSAYRELASLQIMRTFAEFNNDCESTLTIDDHRHAFSSSQIFIKIIDAEIIEIKKAINNEPNKWE